MPGRATRESLLGGKQKQKMLIPLHKWTFYVPLKKSKNIIPLHKWTFKVLGYISMQRPACFILENVTGLAMMRRKKVGDEEVELDESDSGEDLDDSKVFLKKPKNDNSIPFINGLLRYFKKPKNDNLTLYKWTFKVGTGGSAENEYECPIDTVMKCLKSPFIKGN